MVTVYYLVVFPTTYLRTYLYTHTCTNMPEEDSLFIPLPNCYISWGEHLAVPF